MPENNHYTLTVDDLADLREGARINVPVPGSSHHEDLIDGDDFTIQQLDALESGETVTINQYEYSFKAV